MYSEYDGISIFGGTVAVIFYFVALAAMIVGLWKLFEKAGEPGWKAIVPFYNAYTLFKIAMGNGWFFLFMLIPIVNIVFSVMLCINLAKAFGKGGAFAAGLFFLELIFILVLAFDESKYIGPKGEAVGQTRTPSSQPVQTVSFTTESSSAAENNNVWEQPGKDK